MTTDYNKARYLELIEERNNSNYSNEDELLRYSCMLTNQLDWETRDQYFSFIENFLNGNIPLNEYFAKLRMKTYAIIDTLGFLEDHGILLSVDKKAAKFSDLLEYLTDDLEGEFTYTSDEYANFIEKIYIKMKECVNEE